MRCVSGDLVHLAAKYIKSICASFTYYYGNHKCAGCRDTEQELHDQEDGKVVDKRGARANTHLSK